MTSINEAESRIQLLLSIKQLHGGERWTALIVARRDVATLDEIAQEYGRGRMWVRNYLRSLKFFGLVKEFGDEQYRWIGEPNEARLNGRSDGTANYEIRETVKVVK